MLMAILSLRPLCEAAGAAPAGVCGSTYDGPDNNEPWDEGDDPAESDPTKTFPEPYGRRFEIRSFRWLDESEV